MSNLAGNLFYNFRPALMVIIIFTLLFGFAYPLLITYGSEAVMPEKAEGSLIKNSDGDVIGSSLIGQNFTSPKYFWGRLSATTPPYNAAASSGSNLGVNDQRLIDNANARIADLTKKVTVDKKQVDAVDNIPVAIDLITASGSGLDPNISRDAALYQATRIAAARKADVFAVRELIYNNLEKRTFGFMGEPVINVLKLNLLLDENFKVETPKNKR